MSGEIIHHTRGIWRSFILYTDDEPTALLRYLEEKAIPHSWQRYYDIATPHHISLRIEFVDDDELNAFRRVIADEHDQWDETSWDEEELTKRAYEFGAHIFRIYRDHYRENPNLTSGDTQYNLFLGAFHGFFNALGFDYRDEVAFYIQTAAHVYPNVPSLTRYLRAHAAQRGGDAE